MSSDTSHNSKAAKDGNAMETTIAQMINNNETFRKGLSTYTNSQIISAKDIGTLKKATDIICSTDNGTQINIQVKSTKGTSYSGHYHRGDWTNLPTSNETVKQLIKKHILEGNVDTTEALTKEQMTGLIRELCYGKDPKYRPDYMKAVFNRDKSDQEFYICSMDRLVDYFLSNIPSKPMQKGGKHGVIRLSQNEQGKLLGLKRKSGKGRPNDIQFTISINKKNSDLMALFTKIK